MSENTQGRQECLCKRRGKYEGRRSIRGEYKKHASRREMVAAYIEFDPLCSSPCLRRCLVVLGWTFEQPPHLRTPQQLTNI